MAPGTAAFPVSVSRMSALISPQASLVGTHQSYLRRVRRSSASFMTSQRHSVGDQHVAVRQVIGNVDEGMVPPCRRTQIIDLLDDDPPFFAAGGSSNPRPALMRQLYSPSGPCRRTTTTRRPCVARAVSRDRLGGVELSPLARRPRRRRGDSVAPRRRRRDAVDARHRRAAPG